MADETQPTARRGGGGGAGSRSLAYAPAVRAYACVLSVAAACNQQRFTVQEVLDFFGQEAVDRVGRGSVKLRSGGPGGGDAQR